MPCATTNWFWQGALGAAWSCGARQIGRQFESGFWQLANLGPPCGRAFRPPLGRWQVDSFVTRFLPAKNLEPNPTAPRRETSQELEGWKRCPNTLGSNTDSGIFDDDSGAIAASGGVEIVCENTRGDVADDAGIAELPLLVIGPANPCPPPQRENLTIIDTHSEQRFGFFVLILLVNLFRFLRIVVPPEPSEAFRQFRRCQRRVVRSAAKTKVEVVIHQL